MNPEPVVKPQEPVAAYAAPEITDLGAFIDPSKVGQIPGSEIIRCDCGA